MIEIEISNQQKAVDVDEPRLLDAARNVLTEAGTRVAHLSIAIVDDETIHRLNRQYLDHDYATDVLSFLLSSDDDRIEGEVIVSGDTAVAAAQEYAWRPEDELLLYVIHGTLHLVGYDDTTPAGRAEMRRMEQHHLARFDLKPRYDDETMNRKSTNEATLTRPVIKQDGIAGGALP